MFKLDQIDHVALSVSDPHRSARWYQEVLGLERRYAQIWGDRPIMMCVGSTCVALFPAPPAAASPSSDSPARISMRHLAFRADASNYAQAKRELQARQIAFQEQDHQIAHSIYFHDPDGHQIEITTYVNTSG